MLVYQLFISLLNTKLGKKIDTRVLGLEHFSHAAKRLLVLSKV